MSGVITLIADKLRMWHIRRFFSIFHLVVFFSFTHLYAQIRIMPLGNSITHGEHGSHPIGGFRDDLAIFLAQENIFFDFVGTLNDGVSAYPWHEGHPGETAGYIANNIDDWLFVTNPEIILLHIGTNDINSGYTNTRIRNDIDNILNEIWNFDSEIAILVCSTIPRNDINNYANTELSRLIHQLVIQKLQQDRPIRYVGQNEVWTHNDNWIEDYLHDDIHPNDFGYSIMAEVYFNILMNQLSSVDQLITDNFNRTHLGYTWKVPDPSLRIYEIHDYQLTVKDSGNSWYKPGVYIAEMDPLAVSFAYGISVDPQKDGNAGIVMLLDDNSIEAHGYLIYKDSETGTLKLHYLVNGSIHQLIDEVSGRQSLAMLGDEFKVAFYADEAGYHFNCFVNDYFDGELTDHNKLQQKQTDLFAGIMLAGGYNNIIDDFKLIHFKGQAERMFWVSGNNQSGTVNTILADSLVIATTDLNGNPIANIPVTFKVVSGEATIEFPEGMTHIEFEAEQGHLTYPMQILPDPLASGGNYIEVPQEYPDDLHNQAKAEYTFSVSEAGDYVVWGRVKENGINHDSFKILMDQQPEIVWHISQKKEWTWDQVYIHGGDDPKIFNLEAGTHTLTVKNREWAAKLDKIIITKDLNFNPNSTLAKVNNTVITNASGKAYAKVMLGSTPGDIYIQVASSILSDTVIFQATALHDICPISLTKFDGDNQAGTAGEPLDQPFIVLVTDQYENPLPHLLIDFEVIEGNGFLLENQPVRTNEEGKASSTLMLGANGGLVRVQASCNECSDISRVIFEANGIVPLPTYSISGNVYYFSNNEPVNEVIVRADGYETSPDTSKLNGNYLFDEIHAGTSLKITPSRSDFDNTTDVLITPYNAALTIQHAIQLDTLEGFYLQAADVDKNGLVEVYDAALIAYYAVGMPKNSDSHAGEWIFNPPNRQFFNINSDLSKQNFAAILLGDIDGQWNQSHGMTKQLVSRPYMSLHDIHIQAGETFTLPFYIEENQHMISCFLVLEYDPNVLKITEVKKTALTEDFDIVHHIDKGTIRVGLYSAFAMNEAGNIFEITLQSDRNVKETELIVHRFQINNDVVQYATTIVSASNAHVAPGFTISQNYPNPFNPTTIIPYEIPRIGFVRISIYNLLGQKITTLYEDMKMAGIYQVEWDGNDHSGKIVAGGVYICEIVFAGQKKNIKLLKLN